ncbi:MAG: thiamine pyrophosphate-binding protein [Gammaproteobacteria bacterium]|nr:thiamine pyrophosphate-binding protein [Gammaproteobacteria bacterium]
MASPTRTPSSTSPNTWTSAPRNSSGSWAAASASAWSGCQLPSEAASLKRYIDGGEAVLAAFRALGMHYVFCASGSEWAPLWEAVVRQRQEGLPGPQYLDLWHETVAVGMANGYALVTGKPQAVLLHAGPGLLQGSCAIHGALLAGAPMLVMSSESVTYGERAGCDPGSQWYRNLSIVGGPHALAPGIFKWANQAPTIETVHELTIRATEMAQRAPAGPCYLNVPVEVLLEAWTPPRFPHGAAAAGRKLSPPEEIGQLAQRLVAAKHPLVMTETAGRSPAAARALVELCELLAIPVVEPQAAVCANFPRSHPLHQGGNVEPFMANADLVLLVNCRAPWYPPSNRPPLATTIVLDEVPQRPHIVYQVLYADAYLEGDVEETLRMTAAAVRERGFDSALIAQRRERHASAHAALAAATAQAEAKAAANGAAIDAIRLVQELREQCAPATIFVDETITHSRVIQQHLRLDQADRYYYVQGGLGQGIAVALGVKLAQRQRPVVLLIGDGSFIYNPIVPSLAAARDLQLPLLVIVFNNRQYLSMKYNHLRAYPDGAAVNARYFPGVDLSTQPDLAGFAAPFGMLGITVTDPALLETELRRALDAVAAGQSALLNVMLDK